MIFGPSKLNMAESVSIAKAKLDTSLLSGYKSFQNSIVQKVARYFIRYQTQYAVE